jgi:membrane glycosyltransferase
MPTASCAATTLVEMVRRMEADRRLALIQVPPVPVNRSSLVRADAAIRRQSLRTDVRRRARLTGSRTRRISGATTPSFGCRPFAEHCGLPKLPGREPFGGDILSHDFVEAALLARAGWKVRLATISAGATRRSRRP